MLANADQLVAAFRDGGHKGVSIEHLVRRAPHKAGVLPAGKRGIYAFTLAAEYGAGCPAGPGFVLKVGKAGPKSNARWNAHHYGIDRAPSTLAGKLIEHPEFWAKLGIVSLTPEVVGSWLRESTDRDHFLFDAKEQMAWSAFETYLHNRLHPLFEGEVV